MDDDFLASLQECDTKTLEELAAAIENILATRVDENAFAATYRDIREALFKRFSSNQVMSLKEWNKLSEANKNSFNKSLNKALKFFASHNIEPTKRVHELIVRLVILSPLWGDTLEFKLIPASLSKIENLFDLEFPNYRYNPLAMQLLRNKLNV